jgi:uncharacterized protein
MRANKRLVAAFLVGLGLCGAGLFGVASSQTSGAPALKAAAFAATETVVNFSNKGQKIMATWTVPKDAKGPLPTVLVLHGFTGTRQESPVNTTKETMFSRTARVLAEQGYASLRIDFRGSGESEGAWPDTTFSGQISDARAAIAFLGKQAQVDQKRIAVLGLSQGGLVAAATAAAEARVKTLVLWSPVAVPSQTFSELLGRDNILKGLASKGEPITIKLPWGADTILKTGFFEDLFKVNPIAEIARFKRPMLVVVGAKDTTVAPQPQSGQLYLEYHPGQEQLVILDADHLFDIFGAGPQKLDEGIAWSVDWLTKTL